MKWSELNLEAFDEERQQWCKIVDMNYDRNSLGLSNGIVRFWRGLDRTELRTPLVKESTDTSNNTTNTAISLEDIRSVLVEYRSYGKHIAINEIMGEMEKISKQR